jgi:hypothetical protein
MDAAALHATLYPHQRAALAWMLGLERTGRADTADLRIETRVGVLGDPPGAGKTRTVVALIAHAAGAPPPVPPPIVADRVVHGLVRLHEPPPAAPATCADVTVVVVSASLVAQWQRELRLAEATASALVVRVRRDVEALRARLADPPRVVLVCAHRYAEVAELLRERAPRRVVVDEAYHLTRDVPLNAPIGAAFTWLVAAMPEGASGSDLVLARSRCYWSDLRGLTRGLLAPLLCRTPTAALHYACEVRTHFHDCVLDSHVSMAARGVVDPEVQQMLDANDLAGAISLLGGAEGEDLMTVVRRRIARELEATVCEISALEYAARRHELLHAAPLVQARRAERMRQCEARRDRLQRDAEHAEARFADALQADCPICQDALARPVLLACCQTIYCDECILTWLLRAPRCPSCRAAAPRVERLLGADGAAPAAPAARAAARPTKVERVLELVARAPGGVLVYSCHTNGLAALRSRLRAAGHSVAEVKGASTCRDKRLAQFAFGEARVLLLDATHNCAGIDLQAVTDIVMYHDMEPTLKEQIVGRGKRINRTRPLDVHCLWAAE